MPYRHLIFDADNTLFDFDKAQTNALELCFADARLAFKAHYHELYNRINHDLWQAFEQGQLSQASIKEERFARLIKKLELSADVQLLSTAYLRRLAEGHFLYDGALELLEALKKHCRMIIVTNGLKEVQRARFSHSPVMPYLEGLIVSDELGVAKPHAGIFDAAFEMLAKPAKKDVLIIGDSLSSDMQGGINYQIDTCWFNPHKKQNKLELDITHEIRRLEELIDIII